jgi:DNA-binding NtrC family response regulator
MLSKLGYEVEVVEKGETAVEKYNAALKRNERFDLVLLDLTVIGGMGGEMTMRKILEIDPDAKGIVASGYSDNCVLANPKEYGFYSSINKPFRKKELGLAVLKALREL